ncbi:uncharacterized protein UTRI_10388 [Ustilago trichophora]|uniref:Uncharacterized protein n=1 Tax=Ustilago trichophora TaxID=86804 RepID=A0A5C3EC86_9BASI|nr:uncharacterized protein UTRI_10388 [Ustilago trichophora]
MVSSMRYVTFFFILVATLTGNTSAAWLRAGNSRQLMQTDRSMIIASRIINSDIRQSSGQPWLRPEVIIAVRRYPGAPDLPAIAWRQAHDENHGFVRVGQATEYPRRWRKWLLRAKPQHYVYLSSKVFPADKLAKTMKLEDGNAASLVWKYNPKQQRKELVFVDEFINDVKVSWPGLPLDKVLEPWEGTEGRKEIAKPLQRIEDPLHEIVEHVH